MNRHHWRSDEQKPQHRQGDCRGRLSFTPPPGPLDVADRSSLNWLAAGDTPKFIRERSCSLIPPSRILLQALERDRLQILRNVRVELPRARRLIMDDLVHEH